jgi:hypothetical protein
MFQFLVEPVLYINFSYDGAWAFRTMISHQRHRSSMYNILSLTKSAFLAADMILFRLKKLLSISWFSFPFHRKIYILVLVRCYPCPIWPPALPINLTMFDIFSQLSWANLAYTEIFLEKFNTFHKILRRALTYIRLFTYDLFNADIIISNYTLRLIAEKKNTKNREGSGLGLI